jgi:hypothetical protein
MKKKKCLLETVRDNEEFIFFMLYIIVLLLIPEVSRRIAIYIHSIELETKKTIVMITIYFIVIIRTLKILKEKERNNGNRDRK